MITTTLLYIAVFFIIAAAVGIFVLAVYFYSLFWEYITNKYDNNDDSSDTKKS
jgi:hypothetical protein